MKKRTIATISIIALILLILPLNISASQIDGYKKDIETNDIFIVSYGTNSYIGFYLQPGNINIGLSEYKVISLTNNETIINIKNSTGEHILKTNESVFYFYQNSDFSLKVNNISYGQIRVLRHMITEDMFFEQKEIGIYSKEAMKEALNKIFVSTLISTFFICISSFIIFKRFKENEIIEEMI